MDDNPYRSPQWCEEDLGWEAGVGRSEDKTEEPEGPRGVWRWGEVMVVRRDDHVFPQACVRTNETANLSTYLITAVRPGVLVVVFFAFLVPAMGLLLALAVLGTMRRWRLAADVWLPLRFPIVALCGLLEMATVGLVLAGNVVSAIGWAAGNATVLGVGLLLPVLGFVFFWISDRWYVRTTLLGPNYIAVHGAHPGYLASLPELPEAEREVLQFLR
ncbi:MAG: hypothetical protein JW818_16500 [Pirellulales bacterium]|nr:hypothetical protein [Pirellulales bacterium]